MSKQLKLLGLALVLVPFAPSAVATEITVRQDGTGDFLTVNDAIAAASANDTITVGPGTYPEPFIEVEIPLLLRSELGPNRTILDGRSTNRIFRFRYVERTTVQGFTFAFGRGVVGDLGGAIVVGQGANIVIQKCFFHNNTAGAGAALYVTKPKTVATVEGCFFKGNHAPTDGGAIRIAVGATVNVEQCSFAHNSAGVWGGAIHAGEGTTLNVSESLFHSNVSEVGGAIYMYRTTGTIQRSTFWRHDSPAQYSGTLTIHQSGGVTISRNILAEDRTGFGICFISGEAPHDCNVFWDNSKGAIAGGTLSEDEVVSDPLFCGALSGDFRISERSPAAEHNSACGLLIGAFDIGCGTVADTGGDRPIFATLELSQNYPNPFNPETFISFTLPRAAPATLEIFDARGSLVRVLVNRDLSAGTTTVSWNGIDSAGQEVASGVYFYRLTVGTQSLVQKMVVLR